MVSLRSWSVATQRIGSNSDRFQVRWIATVALPTEMVQHDPRLQFAVEQLVQDSMHEKRLLLAHDSCVAVPIQRTSPEPA